MEGTDALEVGFQGTAALAEADRCILLEFATSLQIVWGGFPLSFNFDVLYGE